VNGFNDHLRTPLRTTRNYSAIANLHTLHIATAPAKTFSSLCHSSRSLATASAAEILQLHALRSSCHSLPCRTLVTYQFNDSAISSQPPLQRSTLVVSPVLFFITYRCGPHRKHSVSSSKSIVASLFVSAGTCLPTRCSETAVCVFAYCIKTAVHAAIHIYNTQSSFAVEERLKSRVEAGSNTSIVALRVVGATKKEVSNLRQ
jgi:hypothetical protein